MEKGNKGKGDNKPDAKGSAQPSAADVEALVETVAAKVAEMLTPRLDEIDKAIGKLDDDQRELSDALAKLSDTYVDVKAVVATDWREFAGDDFVKAEKTAHKTGIARKEAMKKLTKFERDTSKVKRDLDPNYAKLKAEANRAVDEAIAAKRKVTRMKDDAMQAIAV